VIQRIAKIEFFIDHNPRDGVKRTGARMFDGMGIYKSEVKQEGTSEQELVMVFTQMEDQLRELYRHGE
jgi:hypothetical protein